MIGAEDFAEYVRAAPLSTVLRRGGKIFAQSDGSAETFALSKPVTRINWFISHTWHTPRWKKFMALSFHANFSFAFACSLVVGLLTVVFSVLGVLPLASRIEGSNLPRYPAGPYGLVLVPLTFQSVLHFGPVVSKRCVFLDKSCVHSDGPTAQEAGDRQPQPCGAVLPGACSA